MFVVICLLCIVKEGVCVLWNPTWINNFSAAISLVGHVFTCQFIFKNGGQGKVEAQIQEFEKIDGVFECKDGDVFETKFSFGPILN